MGELTHGSDPSAGPAIVVGWESTSRAAHGDGGTGFLRSVLAGRERVLGPDHDRSQAARTALAAAYAAAGDLPHAVPLYRAAVDVAERLQGVDHPTSVTRRTELAAAYTRAGRAAEARPLHAANLRTARRTQGRPGSAAPGADTPTGPAAAPSVLASPRRDPDGPADPGVDDPYGALLADVVTPLVYRGNAFRLSGLPVDAAAGQARRRSQELRTLARIGAPAPARDQLLALPEPVDAADIEHALQVLRNPERRLIDELFWFWPSIDRETLDPALTPDGAAARHRWEQQVWMEPPGSRRAAVALHNLAVLTHCQALDGEFHGHSDYTLWTQALHWWLTMLNTDECWAHLAARIEELDDARLTPGDVTALRDAVPEAILSINTTLLVQADQDTPTDRDRRQLQHRLLTTSTFPNPLIDRARITAAQPVLSRLRADCETARQAAPGTGSSSTAQALLDKVSGPLLVLEDLFPGPHPLRDGIRDEVAMTAQTCVVASYNQLRDAAPAIDTFRRLTGIACTTPVKNQILDNQATIQRNLDIAEQNATRERLTHTCWFCQTRTADPKEPYRAVLNGPTRTGTGPPSTGQINVPRCGRCAARAENVHLGIRLVQVLSTLAVIAAWTSVHNAWGWLILFGGLATAAAASLCDRWSRRATFSRATAFPSVAENLEHGCTVDRERSTTR